MIDKVERETGPNLLPDFLPAGTGWKAFRYKACNHRNRSIAVAVRLQAAALVHIPANIWGQTADWTFDLAATGDRKQFFFEAWIRTADIHPAPNGYAYIGVEQLDSTGEPAYAAKVTFEELRTSAEWHKVERLFYLIPTCVKLRVRIGLTNATGSVWATGFRLESRSPQIRINTALGFPQDDLEVSPTQIGMFDADFRLKRVAAIQVAPGQSVLTSQTKTDGRVRWVCCQRGARHESCSLDSVCCGLSTRLETTVVLPELWSTTRGAHMREVHGYFLASRIRIFSQSGRSWRADILKAVSRSLATKCYLHGCETNYASYKSGESVAIRVLVSNYRSAGGVSHFALGCTTRGK